MAERIGPGHADNPVDHRARAVVDRRRPGPQPSPPLTRPGSVACHWRRNVPMDGVQIGTTSWVSRVVTSRPRHRYWAAPEPRIWAPQMPSENEFATGIRGPIGGCCTSPPQDVVPIDAPSISPCFRTQRDVIAATISSMRSASGALMISDPQWSGLSVGQARFT